MIIINSWQISIKNMDRSFLGKILLILCKLKKNQGGIRVICIIQKLRFKGHKKLVSCQTNEIKDSNSPIAIMYNFKKCLGKDSLRRGFMSNQSTLNSRVKSFIPNKFNVLRTKAFNITRTQCLLKLSPLFYKALHINRFLIKLVWLIKFPNSNIKRRDPIKLFL